MKSKAPASVSQPNYNDIETGKTLINTKASKKPAQFYGVEKNVFLNKKLPSLKTPLTELKKRSILERKRIVQKKNCCSEC